MKNTYSSISTSKLCYRSQQEPYKHSASVGKQAENQPLVIVPTYVTVVGQEEEQFKAPLLILQYILINNPYYIANWVTLIYPQRTDIIFSASFFDSYLKFDTNGKLSTILYDKRDSNIPNAHVYEICISQLVHYAWVYSLFNTTVHTVYTKLYY